MQKKYNWHILAWSIFILYQYIDSYRNGDTDFQSFVLVTSYVITILSTFYLIYFFVGKPFAVNNNKFRLVIGSMLGLLFFIGFRYLLEEVLFEIIFGFGNYVNDEFTWYFSDNIWRAFFYGVASIIVVLLEQKNEFNERYLQLANEKSQAEMAFLRSQLNPHFIFNTLSFLHTKTYKLDPELAETVLKLSDMLRYSLQSSKQDKVAIKNEIELLENYIAIFQNRFEGKFFVDLKIQGAELQQRIEPLLLMPFVENAFKHGVLNNPDTPAEVKLVVKPGELIFTCKNKINNFQKDPGSGIGLENVRRRLDLLYPDKHTLDVLKEEGNFSVRLFLDLKE